MLAVLDGLLGATEWVGFRGWLQRKAVGAWLAAQGERTPLISESQQGKGLSGGHQREAARKGLVIVCDGVLVGRDAAAVRCRVTGSGMAKAALVHVCCGTCMLRLCVCWNRLQWIYSLTPETLYLAAASLAADLD